MLENSTKKKWETIYQQAGGTISHILQHRLGYIFVTITGVNWLVLSYKSIHWGKTFLCLPIETRESVQIIFFLQQKTSMPILSFTNLSLKAKTSRLTQVAIDRTSILSISTINMFFSVSGDEPDVLARTRNNISWFILVHLKEDACQLEQGYCREKGIGVVVLVA